MTLRDILAENFLDVYFVKLVSPIYWIQFILSSNCVVIYDNHVTNITVYQKLYTISWIFVVSVSFYYFELSYYCAYFEKDKTLFYTFAFGLLLQYISYLFHVIDARFYKGEQTVKVFIAMQRIDCALKKNNLVSSGVVNYYMIIIWICYTVFAFGIGFVLYVFCNIDNAIYTLPLGLAMMSVYFELVFTATCIYYLAIRLKFLNDVIRGNIFNKKLDSVGFQTMDGPDSTLIISVWKANNTSDVISLYDFTCILTSILKLFHDISKLFSLQLFNIVITVFIWTFLVIESTVVGLRSKLVPISASVILMLWIVFYFVQLTCIGYTCDWFAKQVHCTKTLALHALSVFVEDKEIKVRKAAWEMLQLIEFEKPIFSVYGIFILDKYLPLRLTGVITSNVLVFIQYTSNALNTI